MKKTKQKKQKIKKGDPLGDCVSHAINQYFDDLNGEQPNNLYSMVISEIEKPFLSVVMERVDGNQTRASEVLGINRNTLRKKLKAHLID
jgi:Fis family transcriptional regulator